MLALTQHLFTAALNQLGDARTTSSGQSHCPDERRNVGVEMDYKDRQTGLVLFGFSGFSSPPPGGMSLLMVVALLPRGRCAGALPMRMVVPLMLMYLGWCVLHHARIGSTMSRRWARALILVLSWMWLITGVMSVLMMFWVVRRCSRPAADQAAASVHHRLHVRHLRRLLHPSSRLSILFYRAPA